MQNETYQPIYLKDYCPPDFEVLKIDLHFDLFEDYSDITSQLVLRKVAAGKSVPLFLNGEALELLSIALDDKPLSGREYQLTDENLTISDVPDQFQLSIKTRIKPQENTTLTGLYRSNGMFCTQCESHGFRRMTYFLDRPDVMSCYTTTIVADKQKYPVILSNGNLMDNGELDNGRHWVKWEDPFKKPSYLFALVAGDLQHIEDTFTTQSGREVSLQIYVEANDIDKCDHAMEALKKAMVWDEKNYGREYDLDIYMIVAVSHFNMGAMENKGLNIFNSHYVLAKPDTATDIDYQHIENVIGHEYFHNWTGNRVTCRDWFQLSLKEGLTVFRDQEFSCDIDSRDVKRIENVQVLRTRQFAEDAGPMAHPVRPDSYIEINNFYTMTVYNKGAEVIRMLETLLSKEGFRKGMDLYFQRHDGQAVTTDDFVQAMADANKVDLTQFKHWYQQAGTPQLTVDCNYDAAKKTFEVNIEQSNPHPSAKKPYVIPFAMGLLDSQGNDIPLQLADESTQEVSTTKVLTFSQTKQSFQLINVPEKPVPSFLRNFPSPIKLETKLSEDELLFLMAHDNNGFSRWEASQQLFINAIFDLIDKHQNKKELQVNVDILPALRTMIQSDSIDNALKAKILTLPAEAYIAEQMDVIDIDAIHASRKYLQIFIADQMRNDLLFWYQKLFSGKVYTFESKAVADRSLQNACLALLMCLDDADLRTLCYQQFRTANNMTDKLAATSNLANWNCEERELVLKAFYENYAGEDLVVDKWFSIQARSLLPETIDVVKSLLHHPAFSIENPNKIRALLGSFSMGNPTHFHQSSGAGYVLVMDHIIELNKLNPQIAANLLTPYTQWRRYDEIRQELMQEQLQRIADLPNPSRDVYEIVKRSLA